VIEIKLESVRKIKSWKYIYDSKEEMETHKEQMMAARFTVEKEFKLTVEYGQVLKESKLKGAK
jgi:hypothetical protein